MNRYLVFIFLMFLYGCDSSGYITTEQKLLCYRTNADTEKFISKLDALEIGLYWKAGLLCADFEDNQEYEKAKLIANEVFGSPPPEKRSYPWPVKSTAFIDDQVIEMDHTDWVINRLEKEGIEIKISRYMGENYMVWKESDASCVEKIIKHDYCN